MLAKSIAFTSTLKNIFTDALPIIEKYAPSLAGAFLGPVGMAAGYALPILASAFNAHPHNLADVVKNIINDPDAPQKLASLESEHGEIISNLMDNLNSLSDAEISIKLKWNNSADSAS